MGRPLAAASAAWGAAILAAVAGVLVPGDYIRVSLALFAFSVGLALFVAVVLVADGLRYRRARRRAVREAAPSPLARLEYLPSVTTATRRLRWRGAHHRFTGSQPGVAPAGPETLGTLGTLGTPEHAQTPTAPRELMGSGHPQPASSTRQPRIDGAEASPPASKAPSARA